MRITFKSFFVILLFGCTLLPVSATIFASEISGLIKESLNEIPRELSSPIAKAGLDSIVYNFFRARVKFAPNEYENEKEYKKNFNKVYYKFRTLLYTVDLHSLNKKVTNEDILAMQKSYSIHRKQFSQFANSLNGRDGFFQKISPETILKSQLYFSLLLSASNEKMWLLSRKFTHIWPFCE